MQGYSSSDHATALSVLLEHPGIASDPLLLCSAAKVCSSWRAAVAASGAKATDVVIKDSANQQHPSFENQEAMLEYMRWFVAPWRGFGSWVMQHGHLLRSMQLSGVKGLMACAMLHFHTEAFGAPQLPNLQQLSCSFAPGSSMLAALPCSLTRLDVEEEPGYPGRAEVLAEGVTRLTGLRELHLRRGCCSSKVLAALKGLTCLTQLELYERGETSGNAELSALQEVLPCLTKLEVLLVDLYWDLQTWEVPAGGQLSLGGLKALKQLWLPLDYGFTGEGVVLPAALTGLRLDCTGFCGYIVRHHTVSNPLHFLQLRSLQDLRHLTLRLCLAALGDFPNGVQAMADLQQLDRLELEYRNIDRAHTDCRHWPRLPALGAISIEEVDGDDGWTIRDHERLQEDILAAMPHLRGSLTRLEFEMWLAGVSSETEVSICRHLSGLTKLQKLCLNPFFGEPAARDCMQLSGLRSLTHLDLRYMGAAVDDSVAAALVGNMPHLGHLDVYGCEVHCHPVLAGLPERGTA